MTNTPDGTGNNESIGTLKVHDAIDELLTAETPEEDNVEQVEESVEETQAETEEVEQETAEGNEEEPTEDVAETSEDDAESDEEPDAEEEAEESVYVVEIDGKEMTPDEIKAELKVRHEIKKEKEVKNPINQVSLKVNISLEVTLI